MALNIGGMRSYYMHQNNAVKRNIGREKRVFEELDRYFRWFSALIPNLTLSNQNFKLYILLMSDPDIRIQSLLLARNALVEHMLVCINVENPPINASNDEIVQAGVQKLMPMFDECAIHYNGSVCPYVGHRPRLNSPGLSSVTLNTRGGPLLCHSGCGVCHSGGDSGCHKYDSLAVTLSVLGECTTGNNLSDMMPCRSMVSP